MSNKSSDLHQYSDIIMVNHNKDYQQIDITEETILDNNYESAVIREQDESKYNFYGTNEIVQEIFDTAIDQSDIVWHHNAVRYLIYCWNRLREQFSNSPDQKKKTLWQLISRRMVERGFYFDVKACESKWRSLKKVYMYNKTRGTKKDGSKHQIVWSHYNDMDKAIKGIPYEISDIEDNELEDNTSNNYIITLKKSENENEDENEISEKNVDKFLWTTDSTKELIRLYSMNRKLFSAVNQGGKHLLWEKIAQNLSQFGYLYSATFCNDKWRNLKMTYKKNRPKALKYGVENVKWIYYKDMDDIFKTSFRESTESINDNIITVSLNELEEIKKENSAALTEYPKLNTNDIEDKEHIDDIDGESTLGGTQEIWTEKATKCLIELWSQYRTRFMMAAQGKKRLLWNEISEQLRINGYNYSGAVCDRKWRLLKANYMKRKEKYKKMGMHTVTWQYYYDLDRLLGVPVENVSWSMDSTMSLIECFDHNKVKFMKAATGEKLLIWKEISEEMSQHGFNYSPRACDNKWRTLKNRYNKNRMRANRNKKVVWVYYNKIDSVLREIDKEKNSKVNGINDINSQICEELDEHNYIRTPKPDCSTKTNTITELKDRVKLKDAEYDQRIRKMEEMLDNRERRFEELHQQTLEAINRSNELEAHKIKLLEQLILRLPCTL